MSLFGSIESKRGVDAPDYEVPADEEPQVDVAEYPRTLTYPEVLAALILPIVGVGAAIWRFGRGDIGPGFANLVLALFATAIWTVVILAA